MVSVAGANPSVLNVTAGSLDAVAVAVAVSVAVAVAVAVAVGNVTGYVRLAWLPSPSWPHQLFPQQYAVPPVARPHV